MLILAGQMNLLGPYSVQFCCHFAAEYGFGKYRGFETYFQY